MPGTLLLALLLALGASGVAAEVPGGERTAAAQALVTECIATEVWLPLVLPERDYLRLRRPTVRVEDDGCGPVVHGRPRDARVARLSSTLE